MGSDEALESRYGTMAIPFWVSLVVLLLLLACDHDAAGQPPRHGRTSQHRKTAALISLLRQEQEIVPMHPWVSWSPSTTAQ